MVEGSLKNTLAILSTTNIDSLKTTPARFASCVNWASILSSLNVFQEKETRQMGEKFSREKQNLKGIFSLDWAQSKQVKAYKNIRLGDYIQLFVGVLWEFQVFKNPLRIECLHEWVHRIGVPRWTRISIL